MCDVVYMVSTGFASMQIETNIENVNLSNFYILFTDSSQEEIQQLLSEGELELKEDDEGFFWDNCRRIWQGDQVLADYIACRKCLLVFLFDPFDDPRPIIDHVDSHGKMG